MRSQATVKTYHTARIEQGTQIDQRTALHGRVIAYWGSTAAIAFIFVSSGFCYAIRLPQVIEGVQNLGFPVHFIVLLGVWKVLGGIAIIVPGLPRIKEWAYAGMFFDLTGAAVASTAVGNAWWHIVAPLSVAAILVASWALRPEGRTL
jgi:uncharacterized membrane protein YphA (DoxX/SURF4 family)